jgi:hypothetical protein
VKNSGIFHKIKYEVYISNYGNVKWNNKLLSTTKYKQPKSRIIKISVDMTMYTVNVGDLINLKQDKLKKLNISPRKYTGVVKMTFVLGKKSFLKTN